MDRLERQLLPVSYFHVVFSIPQELNTVFLYNRRVLYDLFFEKAAETLKTFAADERYLGAQCGFIAVLHTWGQLLQFHPHIHFIVGHGGVDGSGCWVRPKRSEGKFLFPVLAVSQVFRGKLLEAIEGL